jgi:outer membrane immunogenic protein
MYKKFIALAIAGLFSSASFAADGDWTGFYIGGNIGSASGNSQSAVTLGGSWSAETQATRDFITNNSAADQSPSGTSYGLQLGYDYQFDNNFVLGIEADYNKLNMDEVRQTGAIVSPIAVTYAFGNTVNADHSYSIRPKFGYAFDNTMIYATGGWSWTSVDFGSDLVSSGGYSKVGASSKNFSSTVWGVGVEHKFNDNWSGRLEYLRVNGGSTDYTTTFRNANFPTYSESFRQDFDYDAIRVGINYRF